MDFAPLSPPTVTSHPGSPATVTGGLDPGWQSSTGEPLPYSLSITGDPPYLSLATNGTPVNMIEIFFKGEKGMERYPEKIAGATNMHIASGLQWVHLYIHQIIQKYTPKYKKSKKSTKTSKYPPKYPEKLQVQLICIWPPVGPPPKASLPFSPWRPGDAYRWFLQCTGNKYLSMIHALFLE